MDSSRQQIVIAGAGPTGLALGAELQRLSHPALILDKLTAGENTSRAAVVHARTLEVLEPLGVTPEFLQNGLIVPTFRVRDRDRLLATVSFKDLKTAYPFALTCPQNRTEAILLKRLNALGGAVRRPCDVSSIRAADGEVEVQYKCDGEPRTVRTKWLVGCDGAHSVVREHAQIPFEGGAYEESFLLADVEMNWPLERDEIDLFFSDKGLMVIAPLPEDRFRVVATVEQPPEHPTIADFESILRERGPGKGVGKIRRMVWSSRFHIQHRVAKTLRKDNIFLCGDAAHVHSPAGGQGMNTGIQDGVSLAAALHEGTEAALQTWEEKRLKIARGVLGFTDRLTKVATTSSPIFQTVRNVAIEILGDIPFAEHALAENLSELVNR
jgi:2-polyprenyl-6-methoxyphenol hydroxylase-like FAD-dependent oxidoreductase